MIQNGFYLYRRYIGISIRSQMQYRASFIMMSFGQFLTSALDFAALLVLFDRFKSIRGWSVYEVGLLYGIIWCAFSLSDSLFRGFDAFGKYLVKAGEFDRILLRPRSTILQLIGHELHLIRIGRLLQGLSVLTWASWMLNIQWTAPKMALILFAVCGAAALFSGLFVIQATLAFWSTETLEIMNTLTDGGRETGSYPLHIYRPWFRQFFTYIVPLACVNYFPVMAILERPDPLGSSPQFQWLAPFIGFAFLLAAFQVWHIGVRHYRSTGS